MSPEPDRRPSALAPESLTEPAGALDVGDRAPDAALLDPTDGGTVMLSSCWRERNAVVVFLRYFGCPFCQAQVATLQEDRERFERTGASIVLVGHGGREHATSFRETKHLRFPLLLDPSRAAYRAYGLVQGKLMQVMGPRVTLPFLKNNLHAETRQRGLRGGDFFQMPGTFVVDSTGVIRATEGIVRYAHRNRHVADSPSNEGILDVLERLA
jgi:peroxiredoxin